MPSRIVRAAEMIAPLLPKRRLTIADVGHGCNLQPLKAMHEILPGEKRLVAVDREPDAAEIARNPALDRLPSTTEFAKQVEFAAGEAGKLPFKDGSVDVLMNVDLWDGYLAGRAPGGKAKPVLRIKGGELPGKPLFWRDMTELITSLREARRVLNPDGFFVVAQPFVPGKLDTPEKVRALLERHRFDVIHLDTLLLVARPRKE